MPPIERLIRDAVAALPREATCDDIDLCIISRRAIALINAAGERRR